MSFAGSLVVFVGATILACQCHLSAAAVAGSRVPVINGKCQYNGTEIPDSEPLKLEFPCEEWTCDSSQKILFKASCGADDYGEGCRRVEGSGKHPDCCPSIICE